VFRTELEAAVHAGIITADQAERLAVFFASRAPQAGVTAVAGAVVGGPAVAPSKFNFSHVLWYAGALIVIGARHQGQQHRSGDREILAQPFVEQRIEGRGGRRDTPGHLHHQRVAVDFDQLR
jgi:hypothetical protein